MGARPVEEEEEEALPVEEKETGAGKEEEEMADTLSTKNSRQRQSGRCSGDIDGSGRRGSVQRKGSERRR